MICHQLNVRFPIWKWLGNKVHASMLKKFEAVWVPDEAAPYSLSGALCQSDAISAVKIGFLSRLEKTSAPIIPNTALLVLTGPQEAKQKLYEKIMQQLDGQAIKVNVVGAKELNGVYANANCLGVVAQTQLQDLYASSACIISHSGYSTIMDLCAVQRHAILIATAGQNEQVYLAEYVQAKDWHLGFTKFPDNLAAVIEQYKQQRFAPLPALSTSTLEKHLHAFLQKLKH
jgi:UDP-N-acetylglucosamine transferase subunit ALG13